MALGLSLIVKDAAATLERALAPLAGIAAEIVAVDTGSTDGTLAILERFGAVIDRLAWADDFAAARNRALDIGRSDWVFSLDADEFVSPPDAAAIAALTEQNVADAYVLDTINFVDFNDPGLTRPTVGQDCEVAPRFFVSSKVRLFRRGAARWEGRVHELVDFSAARAGYRIERARPVVRHDGLLGKPRTDRYKKLAQQSYEEGSAHPAILTTIGIELMMHGRPRDAERIFREAIEKERRYAPPAAWLGRLLAAEQRTSEAIAILNESLRSTLGAPEIFRALIDILEKEGPEQAAPMLQTARRLHPDHPLFH